MLLRSGSLRAFALVAGVALTIGLLTVAAGPLHTFDSTSYSLVADQVRAGRGLRTPLFWLTEELPELDDAGTQPFTLQPPGYPLALAASQAVTGPRLGARALNLLAHLVSALLACAFALRCAGPAAGALAGLGVACCAPLLVATRYAMSETVFGTALLASLLLLASSRDRAHLGYAAAAGVCCALAILIRYPGVVLLAVCLYELGRRALAGERVALVPRGALLLGPGALMFLALRSRGSPWAYDTPRSVGEALVSCASLMAEAAAASHPLHWALLLCGIPLVTLVRCHASRKRLWRSVDLLVICAGGYLGILTIGLTRRLAPENRYAYPALLLGIVVLAVVLGASRRFATRPPQRWRDMLVWILTLGMLIGAGASGGPRRPSVPPASSRTKAYRWVSEHVPQAEAVLSNLPHVVAREQRRLAYGLPQDSHNSSFAVPDDMGAWLPGALRHCRARHVVIFTTPNPVQSAGWTPSAAQLFAGTLETEDLVPVYRGADGVVYRLR